MIGALIIVAIGLVAGGFALVSNGDVAHVTDNSIPNEVSNSSNSSNGNVSLDNNTKVSNVNSNIKVIKDIIGNDLNEVTSSFNSIPLSVIEDDDPSIRIFAFYGNGAAISLNESNNTYPSVPDPYLEFNNVNKSEYILSPNYDKHIFIKTGQNFTDVFVQCVDGDFIALGTITHPLPERGICDLSCGAGDAYFDLNSPYVDYRNYDDVVYYIEHGEYPTNNQQTDDAIPNYLDESGYDYVEESYDVNSVNEELPQENAAIENPQFALDTTTVG